MIYTRTHNDMARVFPEVRKYWESIAEKLSTNYSVVQDANSVAKQFNIWKNHNNVFNWTIGGFGAWWEYNKDTFKFMFGKWYQASEEELCRVSLYLLQD